MRRVTRIVSLPPPSRLLRALLLAGAALLLAGCSARGPQFTGSIGNAAMPQRSEPASLTELAELGRRYDARPGEKRASLHYAQALRLGNQHGQAVAVLQQASISNVGDQEVAAAYGKALADIGRYQEANAVLAQAHNADRPNWRVLSSQGIIADQTGDHTRARAFYQQALQIAPGEPSILANLGLSHVLTKELDKAEDFLRQANAHPQADARIRANLALVLSLRGKSPQVEPLIATDRKSAELGPKGTTLRLSTPHKAAPKS